MSESKYLTAPLETSKMPSGIPFIVGNEAAERFSYYGMRTILVIFMTQHLLNRSGELAPMDDETAKIWVHNFGTAVYFFPLIGAIISDWLFGKYPTILSLSIVYCLGHGVLALLDSPLTHLISPRDLLWLGLALISVGAGGIKPCVSAHVGDQFGRANQHLISRVFSWFYFSINFGSAASTILTPILLEYFGPGWAFGVPGILMSVATFVFWLGRNRFVHIPAGGSRFFKETFSRDGLLAVAHLIPLYVFISMFWALFDQTMSAWVLQAEHMNRVVIPAGWWGRETPFELLSSQIQAANPLMVMVLIPIFSYGVYPFLGMFFTVTPLRKVGMGLFVTILAFALPAWIQIWIDAGQTPHILWQVAAYLIMTAAEVLVSITALEFSYTQAPKKMKSLVMGLYLLSVSVGNQFVSQVNEYIKSSGSELLQGASYYWFFTGCMAVTSIIYVVWSQFYRGHTYIQAAETGEPEDTVDS